MRSANKRRGHRTPYGLFTEVSEEIRLTYYAYGYKEDSMLPELPCPPESLQEIVCPEEELCKKQMAVALRDVVASLTPREAKVLYLRFGLDCASDHTLRETAVFFDVTQERIRQIEAKALRKLRHPMRLDLLKQYIEGFEVKKDEVENPETAINNEWLRLRAKAEKKRLGMGIDVLLRVTKQTEYELYD